MIAHTLKTRERKKHKLQMTFTVLSLSLTMFLFLTFMYFLVVMGHKKKLRITNSCSSLLSLQFLQAWAAPPKDCLKP